jgi:hypothetical protein
MSRNPVSSNAQKIERLGFLRAVLATRVSKGNSDFAVAELF